jgi:CRISPR-associated protein Csb2
MTLPKKGDVVFSLVAQLPLGTYRGHGPDGTPERIPSVARLHAALLCAAGFGPRAVEGEAGWEPSDEDALALRWLEDHPPDEVAIPALRASHGPIAYRADGTIRGSRGTKVLRRLPKQESVVAVDGPFVWTWRTAPPKPVVDALRELCPDVSHLGTAESPVVLTTTDTDVTTTHGHAPDAGMFDQGPGVSMDVPVNGRLAELSAAHREHRTAKVGSDTAGTDERSLSSAPPRQAIRSARYRELARPAAEVPWSQVLLVPLDREVAKRDRVRWAVTAHRALIRILNRDAPPLLTGAYPPGSQRPANRIALQLLDRSMPVELPGEAAAALAVLIPSEAPGVELDAVYRAVGELSALRREAGVRRVIGSPKITAGDRMWREPAAGRIRLWRTDPAAVPDTRGWAGWTFTHAALLSLGFVWQGRGITVPPCRGAARDNAIIDAVNAAGAAVIEVAPVRSARVGDFVHRVHHDAIVRPYTATLALGNLGGATTVQAIGQSRHLGGGLLVPADIEEGTVLW